jgi:hypothetical protein
MFTEVVTLSVSDWPVEEPLVGFKVSQAALSLTDHLRLLTSEFHTFRVWLGGVGPPWVTVKRRLAGL